MLSFIFYSLVGQKETCFSRFLDPRRKRHGKILFRVLHTKRKSIRNMPQVPLIGRLLLIVLEYTLGEISIENKDLFLSGNR